MAPIVVGPNRRFRATGVLRCCAFANGTEDAEAEAEAEAEAVKLESRQGGREAGRAGGRA